MNRWRDRRRARISVLSSRIDHMIDARRRMPAGPDREDLDHIIEKTLQELLDLETGRGFRPSPTQWIIYIITCYVGIAGMLYGNATAVLVAVLGATAARIML